MIERVQSGTENCMVLPSEARATLGKMTISLSGCNISICPASTIQIALAKTVGALLSYLAGILLRINLTSARLSYIP